MDVLVLIVGLLPAFRAENLLARLCGRRWQVARSATVAPCVLWRVCRLDLGDGAAIGFGNQFRHMRRVELGRDAEIHNLNVVTGSAS